MESLGVLLTLPMSPYLESELSRRCRLFRLWVPPPPDRADFLRLNSPAIRAVVGNATVGADAAMIEALQALEIVALYSVGLDKVDLARCRARGIRVTHTPNVLTDDAADLAIGLAISVLRRIAGADRYVRAGEWKAKGDYKLATKGQASEKQNCSLQAVLCGWSSEKKGMVKHRPTYPFQGLVSSGAP